jgi:hypothetical protein
MQAGLQTLVGITVEDPKSGDRTSTGGDPGTSTGETADHSQIAGERICSRRDSGDQRDSNGHRNVKREAEEQLDPENSGGATSITSTGLPVVQGAAMDVEQLVQVLAGEKQMGQSLDDDEEQVRLSNGHEWMPRSLVTQGETKEMKRLPEQAVFKKVRGHEIPLDESVDLKLLSLSEEKTVLQELQGSRESK